MDGRLARAATVEKDHGRLERRVCATVADPNVIAWLDPDGHWNGLRTIARVTATRTVGEHDPTTATRYDVTTLPGAARPIAAAVRSHWGIENGPQRVLDMAFQEDDNRTRAGHSAANLSLSLVRLEPTRKHGITASRPRARGDHDSLLRVLGTVEMQSPRTHPRYGNAGRGWRLHCQINHDEQVRTCPERLRKASDVASHTKSGRSRIRRSGH
ncbi:MAG: ISAs1 family transposase [Chloroflexia bacterium]|nr:ISAs1 family transposase [Chloroflexia bacterium]